ncbi:MAG: substrate-binding domain-containing protein [Firmicutes bacterium]|nr:substrate-binding domain-containing protein [Bacillota bacterium]
MKKKNIALITVLSLVMAGLSACGNNTETDNSPSKSAFDSSSAISVVSREDGSGTRGAFIELFGIEEKGADGSKTDKTTKEAIIANKTDVMITNVSGEENAIGYVSMGSLSESVKALKIDGTEPTTANVKNGSYKISRPFNIATKDGLSEAAQNFIDYILSADGQKIVSGSYIPVDDAAKPFAGSNVAGKITVAGSSSVSPVMEKLKEAYMAVNPNAEIEIQTSDSTSGMMAATNGTCDIGMASRELKDSEIAGGLTATPIALDGIAVIVNNDNPTDNLTSEQVKSIFTGAVSTWDEVK